MLFNEFVRYENGLFDSWFDKKTILWQSGLVISWRKQLYPLRVHYNVVGPNSFNKMTVMNDESRTTNDYLWSGQCQKINIRTRWWCHLHAGFEPISWSSWSRWSSCSRGSSWSLWSSWSSCSSWSSGQTEKPGQTGQTGHREQTDLTFKLDFPGNLCWAAFAILEVFWCYGHFALNVLQYPNFAFKVIIAWQI